MPAAELAVRLAEAYRLIGELTAQIERLSARVEQLERQARKDSSTSSRPPSSDSPYKKKGGDRSLRERGKRRPGKQPGDPGSTMNLVDDPDERIDCPPAACCGCGAGLAGAPVMAQRRHQVTDIERRRGRRSPSTWRRRRSARVAESTMAALCLRQVLSASTM